MVDKRGRRKKIFNWDLVLVMVYAVLNLAESYIVTLPAIGDKIAMFLIPLPTCWGVLNMILLVIFFTQNYERVAYILPIYYIADYFLSIILGAILVYKYGITSLIGQTWLILLTAFFSIFEIGFALYLFYRKV